MNCPRTGRLKGLSINCVIVFALVLSFSGAALAQAGTSQMLPIDSGSLIIAMDNTRQGNPDGGADGCSGPAFNLRAYGLAVRLLHRGIPVMWAIGDKKLTPVSTPNKDNPDFSAAVNRISGQTCAVGDGGPNVAFSGGPLIIDNDYLVDALDEISDFNDLTSGTANDVRVYQATSGFTAPIRYTLTHKPVVALGPETSGGGGFATSVYAPILQSAGLIANTHYKNVTNDDLDPDSCITLAAQAHATNSALNFIDNYRDFVEAGGNLMLQCHSIHLFEDHPDGLFQTTNGWRTLGVDADGAAVSGHPSTFPNPAMAYSQFIGGFSDQQGNTSEYRLPNSGSSLANGTAAVVQNNGASGDAGSYVATVSRPGTGSGGGNVFQLGGHDYRTSYSGNTELTRINGQRLLFNAILVPASRPGCGLAINSVTAFKSVAMAVDSNNSTTPDYGETVEWTLRYINDGTTDVEDFQVADPLDFRLKFVGPIVATKKLTPAGGDIALAVNGSYTGNANVPGPLDTNLLAGGSDSNITLEAGAQITIKVRTVIQGFNRILNQGTASGTGIGTPVLTDNTDLTTTGTVNGYPVACPPSPIVGQPCIPQTPDLLTGGIDPTGIDLGAIPTAAPANVQGSVGDATGRGIAREVLTLTNATTGEQRFAMTNTFGRFNFMDVPTGEAYILSIESKRYVFSNNSFFITLNENVSGISFTADAPKGETTVTPPGMRNSVKVQTKAVSVAPAQRNRIVVLKPSKKADEEKDSDN